MATKKKPNNCPENTDNLRTYLIVHEDGTRRKITIPSTWRVTFGPAARGGNMPKRPGGPSYKMPMALRFYENDTQQRAIFTDVVSFRDMSIPIQEEGSEQMQLAPG